MYCASARISRAVMSSTVEEKYRELSWPKKGHSVSYQGKTF
jgi:hypothetical protein